MRTLKISLLVFILSISISSQNFWQQTNGPYSGASVYDFLLYNDSTIFIATKAGLIKSSDNGNSWTRLNSYNVTCLGLDKLNAIYFGISGHLRRSIDAGNSWTDIPISGAAIKDFVISYTDTIIVGSWDAWSNESEAISLTNGVYRSFDYGNTWNLANNGIEYPGVYALEILSDNSILVGTSGGGIYKSTNWGDLWISSNNGIPFTGQYRYAESLFEFAPGQVLTGTHNSIYYSSNYGDSWTFKGNGYNNNIATCFKMDQMGTIYAGSDLSDGVYFSIDQGNNWSYLGLGISTRTLGWDAASRLYAGGLSSGLYRYMSLDSSWISVFNQGYAYIEVNDLSLSSNVNIIASTEWYGVYNTSNEGELWTHTNYQGYEPRAIEFINDSIILAGQYDFVNVSYDTGKTWQTTGNFEVASIYYDEVEQIIYLGSKRSIKPICGIFTSSDFGQTWSLLYEFPHINLAQWINEIFVTRNNHVILASEIATAPHAGISHLYKSTDRGITWETIYQDYDRAVTSILQDVNNTLYALAYEKLMISEDEGQNWITRISEGRTVLATDFSGRIYKDNGIGVKYSSDKGITWILVDNSGLNNWVNDIVINKNNRIFLATSAGVYYGDADNIVVSTEDKITVNSFSLSQNYPNPFNPTTKIKYSILSVGTQHAVSVQLIVYDILGNEIATLVNEDKPAGEYEVEFSVGQDSRPDIASGIYFYRIKAGKFVATKKMILLR